MNCSVFLKSGDRIIITNGKKEYPTTVDEVIDDENFSVLQPTDNSNAMPLVIGDTYKVICKKGGLHLFDVMSMRSDVSGKVDIVYLRYSGNYTRIQRRDAFRCSVMLEVDIRKRFADGHQDEEWLTAHTLDISETGMRMRLPMRYMQGDVIECQIKINRYGINAILEGITGMIVRSVPTYDTTKDNLCGIRFAETDEKARNTLLKLVILSQRKTFADR